MTPPVIEVHDLVKSYGPFQALKGIDLEVHKGEVFALLGPNGAGKTTAVEIMEGHRDRTSGDVRVLGLDPAEGARALRERIGIVLQSTGVEPYLTVEEAIEMYRGYYPGPLPLDAVIEAVGLEGERGTRVNRLSGGQRRRLDVGIGIAGGPQVLFLDEPTTGFDPSARRNAWQMIDNLASAGTTVFLTTHYMEEAQHLADRVAIIVEGRIVAEGAPGSLGRDREPLSTTIRFTPSGAEFELPRSLTGKVARRNGAIEVRTSDPLRDLYELTGRAIEARTELRDLTVSRPSLEDVYLELTEEPRERGE
jgi:ABC-type multidrug transport system ATPase subunit